MFYYPNRTQAIKIQQTLETLYNGIGGKYYYGDSAWEHLRAVTGIDLLSILTDIANKKNRGKIKMTVLKGDNLEILKTIESSSIDLIYMDPPFFTQKTQKLSNNKNIMYSFEDTWTSIEDYKEFLSVRLEECKRVLKNSGSIFVHCDKIANHHIRLILDNIFGADMFQSEIIWNYKRWSNSKKGLLNNHQNIYFYSKSKDFKFNTIFTEYSSTTNIDQILVERKRNGNSKTIYKVDNNGNYILAKEKNGVPLSDVWNIPFLNPKAKERVGYPTQKPILLLEQIIKIATDKNDIVLDPFCGSGTTLVASKILNRNYMGIDLSEEAINITQQRLENVIKTSSNLLNKGIEAYRTKTEEEENILKLLQAKIVQRNKGIDGFLPKHFQKKPIPIKIQKNNECLNESISLLQNAINSKKLDFGVVIKTHSDNLLFDFDTIPENIIVVDHFELTIEKWLSKSQQLL
ncbi:DNA modification methyltransferase M.XbaI [Streptococcus pneumoniae]|uniref:Methyltransferase n=25 Tax=Streptococcus pneumoniae TaxID=1313 RepID=A0A110RR68_STREE|nr:DNA methyltransferase [Streptococcus pneumoniae]CKB53781.1 DNA modification methyltransferase M.XbaI [Streptococcus pneumoniae]CKB81734.1 DNA modification methyltransferase M.XbaI [Streptococcus pneumoniae]CKB84373.1 DNA modification methyltransferase M.XbaI [Streptococcus pneumoniae]CMW51885.1 DNA modification methyltransferase M.XbaI [Streptococcus pneumoniae]